jgi:hypothetical protein
MRNCMSVFLLIALLFAGCVHQKEQAAVSVQPAPVVDKKVQTIAVPAVVTHQFITTFGEHPVGGIWTVRVPEPERTVEIGAYGGFNQPSAWRLLPASERWRWACR